MKFVVAGTVLPFAAGGYIVALIIVMGIWGLVTNRDMGFGDSYEIPLHNGFRWSAIDITDRASIYANSNDGASAAQNNVLALQQHDDWLAGATMQDMNNVDFDQSRWRPDLWFLLNTKTHEQLTASSEAQLRALAAQRGFTLELMSSSEFYGRNRFRWFDGVVLLVLTCPALLGLLWLYRKARRLLHNAQKTAGPDVERTVI